MKTIYLDFVPTKETFFEQFKSYDQEIYKEMVKDLGVRKVSSEEMSYWVTEGKAKREKSAYSLSRDMMSKMILRYFVQEVDNV